MGVFTNKQLAWMLGGGAVVLYLIYKNAATVGTSVGVAAGQAAGGAVTGAAQGVLNSTLGVPLTSKQMCEAAKAAGDSLAASQYCDVTDYLNYIFNR